MRPLICQIFPFNLIESERLPLDAIKREFEFALQRYIHDSEALCFQKDFHIGKSEEEYFISLWDLIMVEMYLTIKKLQIIDETLFNSINNRLRNKLPITANGQMYNATIDELLSAIGIDKEIWNDFKEYFLHNIKQESSNKMYLKIL